MEAKPSSPCYNHYFNLLNFTLHYHLSFLPPAKLIELIEVLVSHSISSVEMKSFLRLLGPNSEGHLPTYSHVLQELLLKMALKNTRVFPLHYVDLTATDSVSDIKVFLYVCVVMLQGK